MEIEETEKKTSTKKTSKASGRNRKDVKKPEAKIATTGAEGVKTLERWCHLSEGHHGFFGKTGLFR